MGDTMERACNYKGLDHLIDSHSDDRLCPKFEEVKSSHESPVEMAFSASALWVWVRKGRIGCTGDREGG